MEDLIQRYDPELIAVLQALQDGPAINWDDLPTIRKANGDMLLAALSDLPDSPSVMKEDRMVPGPQGAPEVLVRIYRPAASTGILPALFWIHGGGYILGSMLQDELIMQHIVETVGCVAVSVEYRLAPEHPFPAPVEDCYAALKWVFKHAGELGLDPGRIAVGGASAGGGLAAGLVLLARDRGEIPIAFQLLICPMIDNLNASHSGEVFAEAPVWSKQNNQRGWQAYVGNVTAPTAVSPYAAASQATDLSNLPPAYITVGSMEVFLDEDVEYALRLARAGIPVELHVYPRVFHGFHAMAPESSVARQFTADRDQALKRALRL